MLLIKGDVSTGGENIDVWVRDGLNHLILRAESTISVGSIKANLNGYKNLRHSLTSSLSVNGLK